MRLCLDPEHLKQAIKRPHYFTLKLQDVFLKLNGAKSFSFLDTRSGYWDLKPYQTLCTTFNSPFDGYRVLRLPGLGCAQDIFQRKVDEMFGNLPCVTGIAGDIVVYGFNSDLSFHDENLPAVL